MKDYQFTALSDDFETCYWYVGSHVLGNTNEDPVIKTLLPAKLGLAARRENDFGDVISKPAGQMALLKLMLLLLVMDVG